MEIGGGRWKICSSIDCHWDHPSKWVYLERRGKVDEEKEDLLDTNPGRRGRKESNAFKMYK